MEDARNVGGKGASLGELYRSLADKDIRVPDGYVTTTSAYQEYLTYQVPDGTWDAVRSDELPRARDEAARAPSLAVALETLLRDADPTDPVDLHARSALARSFCMAAPVPEALRSDIETAYAALCEEYGGRWTPRCAPPPPGRTRRWRPSPASTSRT